MAETSENRPDVPVPARPAKKRRILWLTILLIPILLVILTGVMLLGSPHRWQVSPRVSMAEAARLQGIIGKLTSAMVTEDGKMVEKAEIELTPSEINTLLITGLRAAQLRQKPDLYYDAEWSQGALLLRGSKILPVFAVNVEAEIIPAVSGGKVSLAVRSCWVGWISISPKLVEEALKTALKKHENRKEYRAFTAVVESAAVKDGSMVMLLRPDKIKMLVPLLVNAITGRL